MFFITLFKLKGKPTKENIERRDKALKDPNAIVKIHSIHWTLGRYDGVIYSEAPNEKAILAMAVTFSEAASSETLVAIPREDALKAVGLR